MRGKLMSATGFGDVGAASQLSAQSVVDAVGLVRSGRVFDLDPGRFPGMPKHPAQPAFDLITYRSPRGQRVQQDVDFLTGDRNAVNFGFVLETVTTSMHMGAHIDALCHVTAGPESTWYGGFKEAEHLGDKGALTCDASKIPAILTRGVLIDVADANGVDVLPPSHPITAAELQRGIDRQGLELRRGDVCLLRTGQMAGWPEVRSGSEAGLSLDGARWLAQFEPVAIGADNSALEVDPSGVDGSPQPVHIHLIIERGIYILEWMMLEELAEAKAWEFLFVCLPLKIRGATGSLVRPVAVV
jgi:kynurenine formamidase